MKKQQNNDSDRESFQTISMNGIDSGIEEQSRHLRTSFITFILVLLVLAIVELIAGSPAAQAQPTSEEPPAISTDRPAQTTPPSILIPGYVQLEAGFQLASDKLGPEGFTTEVQTFSLPGALVRIGLLRTMELRLATEFRSVKQTLSDSSTTSSGLTGLSVGTKISITPEQGVIPETSFLLTLGLPEIGNEAFRPAAVAPSFLFSMRNALSSSTNLYYNLGAYWDGVNSSGTGLYTLLLGATLAENFSGFIEVYGNLKTGIPPLHAADAGLSYVVAPNLQFDVYGGVGITDSAPDFFANAGVSLRFPR